MRRYLALPVVMSEVLRDNDECFLKDNVQSRRGALLINGR